MPMPNSSQTFSISKNQIIFLCTLFSIFTIIGYLNYEPSTAHIPTYSLTRELRNVYYPYIQPQFHDSPKAITDLREIEKVNEEWMPVMKAGKVVAIDHRHSQGFSEKYKVYFQGGYVAMCKPAVETEAAAARIQMKTVDFYSIPRRHRSGSRSGYQDRRLTQGWAEIAAYHMDQVLDMNRKPPIVGRSFTNHFFYAFDNTTESVRKRSLPTYSVFVSLTPWMRGMKDAVPDVNDGKILYVRKSLPTSLTHLELLRLQSDTIIFDFLIDDHDRHNVQNWVGGVGYPLLLWDSGLSWLHGPETRSDCDRLLCGPRLWRENNPGYDDMNCQKICRFSRHTVLKLRAMGEDQPIEHQIGYKLKQSLSKDPLSPVFNLGVFTGNRRDAEEATVHFLVDNFYKGMNRKLSKLLKHISNCIEKHGEQEVLF